MSRLNWDKNNIDIAQVEIERLMRKTDDDDKRMLYGIIRATLWAVGHLLEWVVKHQRHQSR